MLRLNQTFLLYINIYIFDLKTRVLTFIYFHNRILTQNVRDSTLAHHIVITMYIIILCIRSLYIKTFLCTNIYTYVLIMYLLI